MVVYHVPGVVHTVLLPHQQWIREEDRREREREDWDICREDGKEKNDRGEKKEVGQEKEEDKGGFACVCACVKKSENIILQYKDSQVILGAAWAS